MKTLDELKKMRLPKLDWRDVFKTNPEHPLTVEETERLDQYFKRFLAPTTNEHCIRCGSSLFGPILGMGTFHWKLVHGEAECDVCKYPIKVLHKNIGPIESLELVLQFHPDSLWDDDLEPETLHC